MRSYLLAPLALLASACGDPLFFAQVQDPRVCVQVANETIPAAPAGVAGSVTWQGQFDLGSQIPGLDQSGTTGTVSMLSFEVQSTTDMSGISEVMVDLPSVASGHYIDYTQAPPVQDPNSILMTPTQNANLLPALTDGGLLPYSITFTGSPPTVDWQADLTVCVSVSVEVNFLKVNH